MRLLMTVLGASLLSASALAAGYSEKKLGDLSDDGLAPTAVKLKSGPNVIAGKYGTANGVTDRDYFTVKIMDGQTLDSIILEPETLIGGDVSFIGVQAGKKVTVPPVGGTAEDLLGWTHYGTSDEGTDILPAMGEGFGAIGFTPPLGAGTYSFWVQETGVCSCKYRFTFNVGSPATR
jgi:hypothetical protein